MPIRPRGRTTKVWSAALLALAAGAAQTAHAAHAAPAAQADPSAPAAAASLDRRVSVNLDHVAPAEAFRTFAQLAGLPAAVDAEVRDPITVRLENVRVRTMLDAICESVGCRWEVTGSPAALHVRPLAGRAPRPGPARVGLGDPVELRVDSDAREILRTLASLLDAELAVDPALPASALAGEVKLDAAGVPLRQALDDLCRQARCTWALGGGEDGGRRTLKVFPQKP